MLAGVKYVDVLHESPSDTPVRTAVKRMIAASGYPSRQETGCSPEH
jgi:hypothetical protein